MHTTLWGEVSFWLHLPIFVLWLGAFLIPESLWSNVVFFHFWYIALLYALAYLTGFLYVPYTKKLLMLCVLTLLTQRLRGYAWTAPETWGHSFVGELSSRLGFAGLEGNESSFDTGTLLTHATFVLVAVQYFFGILTL